MQVVILILLILVLLVVGFMGVLMYLDHFGKDGKRRKRREEAIEIASGVASVAAAGAAGAAVAVSAHKKGDEKCECVPTNTIHADGDSELTVQIKDQILTIKTTHVVTKDTILDYMDFLRQSEVLYERYKPGVGIIFKQRNDYSDSLHYLDKSFAMLRVAKDKSLILQLRLGRDNIGKFNKKYPQLKASKFPESGNWFELELDEHFKVESMYELLDFCYATVVHRFHDKIAVNTLIEQINYDRQHLQPHYLTSKKRIMDHLYAHLPANEEIKENEEYQLPTTLSVEGSTYALVYERSFVSFKGEDNRYMQLVLRLAEHDANNMHKKYPAAHKARFPKGDDWYFVPVDKSFVETEEVYELLNLAKAHVLKILAEKEEIKHEYHEAIHHKE